ncbi:histidinol dehydrogenase [Propioniferax innocua]|uniref:Histidinol dehydrogenase n=1 Tax=Propioniferax innocua TaxID=1753 RepID=A0A542ZPZ6_9ACTN|nr:histidinol dehydrogenase [Propioniferax innocua]
MLTITDLRGRLAAGEQIDYPLVVPRATFDVNAALNTVQPVCDAVAAEGAAALKRFSERFDHCVPPTFRVPQEKIDEAVEQLDPTVRKAIQVAIARRRSVCAAEMGAAESEVELAAGAKVVNRTVPVRRVGLYVPGGLAPLSSSVVMNVVPAQVAGVEQIAVASPPQADHGGYPHPTILAVCGLLGVSEVLAVGGAQAVAMFAHGVTDVCERVDLVTGPGNIYVVAAKRLLRGLVGIDSEAGPTEIAVLADDSADPAHVAADLISQAEHDPLAGSVLVTDSVELAERVNAAIAEQVPQLANIERIETALAGEQSGIVLVDDLDQGIDVVDAYAAEHLEVQTRDASAVAARVRNAGAIFVGPYSPVPLGDYCAGSTHVLPTGGAARHSSGLTVHAFQRVQHIIEYDEQGLAGVADDVIAFADAELLPGHAQAIRLRARGA